MNVIIIVDSLVCILIEVCGVSCWMIMIFSHSESATTMTAVDDYH